MSTKNDDNDGAGGGKIKKVLAVARGELEQPLDTASAATTVARLRSGELDLIAYLGELCDEIDRYEPLIHALLPGTYDRESVRVRAFYPFFVVVEWLLYVGRGGGRPFALWLAVRPQTAHHTSYTLPPPLYTRTSGTYTHSGTYVPTHSASSIQEMSNPDHTSCCRIPRLHAFGNIRSNTRTHTVYKYTYIYLYAFVNHAAIILFAR